jgi:putative tricarboxylic transport membrane protein
MATFSEPWLPTPEGRSTLARTALATALSLVYTLVLVGHGLPFWLVTAGFVLVFMLLFYVPERRARGETLRGVVLSAVVAIATSAVVTLMFERVFLVRMP